MTDDNRNTTLNPFTGRMVTVGGRVHRKLVGGQPAPYIPHHIVSRIVSQAAKNKDARTVANFARTNKTFRNETRAMTGQLKTAHKLSIPKDFFSFVREYKQLQDAFSQTPGNYLYLTATNYEYYKSRVYDDEYNEWINVMSAASNIFSIYFDVDGDMIRRIKFSFAPGEGSKSFKERSTHAIIADDITLKKSQYLPLNTTTNFDTTDMPVALKQLRMKWKQFMSMHGKFDAVNLHIHKDASGRSIPFKFSKHSMNEYIKYHTKPSGAIQPTSTRMTRSKSKQAATALVTAATRQKHSLYEAMSMDEFGAYSAFIKRWFGELQD